MFHFLIRIKPTGRRRSRVQGKAVTNYQSTRDNKSRCGRRTVDWESPRIRIERAIGAQVRGPDGRRHERRRTPGNENGADQCGGEKPPGLMEPPELCPPWVLTPPKEETGAPRKRKEAGTMLSAVKGAASPWFTGMGSDLLVVK